MSLTKQAKILSEAQQRAVLAFLATTKLSRRNQLMFLLSFDAALRAKEIAHLTWEMVTDAEGNLADEIRLEDKAAKGKSGGTIPISKRLKEAFVVHGEGKMLRGRVIKSARGNDLTSQVVINFFWLLYRDMGYDGRSSHSGRRTAITRWSRKISTVGGSMKDVQMLARHSSLQMTQRYVEVSEDACRRVVG
jgi:integrase/recombinase XerD